MTEPWAQVLVTAWLGIVVLLHVWAIKRDIRKRTISLTPITDNQFDQYAEKLQHQMVIDHTIPGWLLRQRPWKDKTIFEIRRTPTGEIASVRPVPEMKITEAAAIYRATEYRMMGWEPN